jgi:hypothetical protein
VIEKNGAEILRLWVMSSDYAEDLRIGPEIIKANVESYRRLRNTMRWLLGNLAHFRDADRSRTAAMPELDRYVLHRLAELDALVRRGYRDYDFRRIFQALFNFAAIDLSAFYFDIRKDALYCEPASSTVRKACLTVLDEVFSRLTAWLAPMLPFTMDEAWLSRFPSEDDSVHLRQFPETPQAGSIPALDEKWRRVRRVRRVVTGALEDRARGQAHRREPGGGAGDLCLRSRPPCRGHRRRPGGNLDHQPGAPHRGRRARPTPIASTTCPASPWWRAAPRGANAPARGRSCPRSGPIPTIPISPRATRGRCANSRRARRRSDGRLPPSVGARHGARRGSRDRRLLPRPPAQVDDARPRRDRQTRPD